MPDDPIPNPVPPAGEVKTPPAADPPPDKKPENVPYDTHRRLLDEKKKVTTELETLRAEKAERERKEAEEKGEFKKLLEQERAERAKVEDKLKTHQEQESGRRKLAAIINGAGGNIDRKWFPTIDAAGLIDQVIIDPTTGEVDSTSVAKAVEKLKVSYPEIVTPAGGPRVPNGNPAASGGAATTIRHSDWKKLPYREMNKWRRDQIIDD